MEIEYILYIQSSVSDESFFTHLNKFNIPYQIFTSSKHHPRAILLHRVLHSKKIISSEYSSNCTKVALIYINSLNSIEELESLSSYFPIYLANNVKVMIIMQGVQDLIESLKFHDSNKLPKDYYEDWLVNCMIQGIDCIETDSYKESCDLIHRILTILTKSPYKQEASIYRLHSKKLLPNTEICEENKD